MHCRRRIKRAKWGGGGGGGGRGEEREKIDVGWELLVFTYTCSADSLTGPHQLAHTSTKTGLLAWRTSASKLSSVTSDRAARTATAGNRIFM